MGLNYYADMKDTPLSDLLIKANIKTDNQFLAFYDFSWKGYKYTGISTWVYNIFYKGGTIDHITHFPGPVSK